MKNEFFNDEQLFDRHFTSVEKTIKCTWALLIALWVMGVLLAMTLMGTIIWFIIFRLPKLMG